MKRCGGSKRCSSSRCGIAGVRTLARGSLVLAGAAWLAWWWWQESHRENAAAWARGTDRIR